MPSTVNGIGTWYYGKDHLVTRHHRCEFCGSAEQLKSYDTTLYFVVLFIPLIPLGRKRILNECPRCKRHRAAKLSEWEKRKSEAILGATQAWQQDRSNSSKAIEALGTTIGFHDVDSFRQLAKPVSDAFARDANVQIFLGDSYDHFGEKALAEECYRAALINRPDEASQEALARFQLRQMRPAEAEQLLAHILTNRVRPKAPLIMAVAEGYQAIGDHERAWHIVDEVGTTFPDLLSDPTYEKIRRSVSRHRGTTTPVRVAAMDSKDGAKETNWLHRHMGLAIAGSVLIAAGMWYLLLAWSLGKHTVSILNGTPVAYTVDINGQQYALPPMGRVSADIREGTLRVNVPDSSVGIAPQTIEMRTNFWHRPWNRRNMIINPDHTALIVWHQTEYAVSPDDSTPDPPNRVYLGEAFYDLDKVDYLFEKFPLRINLPDDKPQIKTRLEMPKDDVAVMMALTRSLSDERQIVFLRKHLGDRPLRLQFHRQYQGLVQTDQPDYDIAGEYRALLKKDPENPTLSYLLGRVVEDRDEATVLFRKGADSPTAPCAYAAYALAYDALNAAQFEEALKRAQQAMGMEPENSAFRETQIEALDALHRTDDALALIKGAEKHDGHDGALVATEVRLLAAKSDVDSARKRIDGFCKEVSSLVGNDAKIQSRLRIPMESVMHYAAGDMPAYKASIAAQDGVDAAFAAAVTDEKIDAAQTALEKAKDPSPGGYFILYIAAVRAHRDDVAKSSWSRAIELMSKEHQDDRIFAKSLAGSAAPSAKALRNWTTLPLERCVALTALGLRFPEKRSEFFSAARQLNYSRRFPYHLIDQTLSTGTTP